MECINMASMNNMYVYTILFVLYKFSKRESVKCHQVWLVQVFQSSNFPSLWSAKALSFHNLT